MNIYLDGLSKHIHGNPVTHEKDRQIREQLRSLGYEVLEIPYTSLFSKKKWFCSSVVWRDG